MYSLTPSSAHLVSATRPSRCQLLQLAACCLLLFILWLGLGATAIFGQQNTQNSADQNKRSSFTVNPATLAKDK